MKRCISLICVAAFSFVIFSNCQSQIDKKRDRWQQPEKIMDVIGVKEGMVIGEAGAGKGYFTFKLSSRVGETGKIYANEIDKKKIKHIEDICEEDEIKNIITILGEVDDPLFPDGQMDMIIMVYVFHDLAKPVEFMQNLKPDLKPGAKVVIVDRDPDKHGKEYDHFYKKEKMVRLINESEYQLEKIETFLERDNIFICSPE